VTSGGWSTGVRDFVGFAGKIGNTYSVITINTAPISSHIQARAICARGPGTTASSSSREAAAKAFAARLAEVRAENARAE
jgi:hypothetical protein